MRVALEKSRDIREILLTLARPARSVHGGPDFPLQDIFHSRHGEQHAEDGALFGARNEGGIAGIELKLHAQIAVFGRQINAVWEAVDPEIAGESGQKPVQFAGGDRQVEIEADQWLDVGVHRLSADDTVGDVQVGEPPDQALDRGRVIRRHDTPERACAHKVSPKMPLFWRVCHHEGIGGRHRYNSGMGEQGVEAFARKHGVRLLLQFGSTVSGRTHAGSDVDLAVLLERAPDSLWDHGGIVADLQPFFPGREVDLAIVNRADPLFLKQILDRCQLLYGTPRMLAELKMYAFTRYQDHRRFLGMEREYVRRKIGAVAR